MYEKRSVVIQTHDGRSILFSEGSYTCSQDSGGLIEGKGMLLQDESGIRNAYTELRIHFSDIADYSFSNDPWGDRRKESHTLTHLAITLASALLAALFIRGMISSL